MERLWLTPFYVYQVSYFTDLSLFSTILLIIWVKTEKNRTFYFVYRH
ncbi:unknown [Bacteroides sp. CAG:633]|nr:unknown [Bacteroides sp. CAG:633]